MNKIKQGSDWKVISKDMEIIKNLLSFGFYYSFTYDLTLNTDKIHKGYKEHEAKFWWNDFMLKDLKSQNISKSWQIAMIQVKNIESSPNKTLLKGLYQELCSISYGEKVGILPNFTEIM